MAEGGRRSVWLVVGCVGLALLSIPCVGVIAAIAIPAFVNYARRAKTAEARAELGVIRNGLLAECTNSGGLLPSPLGPTLASPSAERQIGTIDPRWTGYGLTSEPFYYSYSIERPDGSTAVAVAVGDLDGDGTRSRFAYRCTSDATSRGCTCGELEVTDELE